MMMVGACWSGPVGLMYYRYVNPWYLGILRRLFPTFIKGFSAWRRTYVSIFVDCAITHWLFMPVKILITGLIGSKGDIRESFSGVKRKLWPTMIMFWLYAPPQKLFLYFCIPIFYRGIG